MPTNRKRRRIRRREGYALTHDLAHELADGRKFQWWNATDPDVYAAAWEEVGAVLTSWFARHHPGSRPHGWWTMIGTQQHAEALAVVVPDRSLWPVPHQGRRWRERSPFRFDGERSFLCQIGEVSAEELARAKAYDPHNVEPLDSLWDLLGVAPHREGGPNANKPTPTKSAASRLPRPT